MIYSQANTRKIEFVAVEEEEKLKKLKVSPNYKALGPAFKGEIKSDCRGDKKA